MYFFGLSILILFFLAHDIPQNLVISYGGRIGLLVTALVLAVGGFFAVFIITQDQKKSFRRLAWVTLIPAVLSLAIAIFGKATLLAILERYVFEFKRIEPLVLTYLDRTVPKIQILTAAYLFLGFLFLYVGLRKKKKG